MENLFTIENLYSLTIVILIILAIVEKVFEKKIGVYKQYIKYVIDKLVEKADEMYDKLEKQNKHSFVAEKIYKIIPKFIQPFFSESKIDRYIHDAVDKLREKEKLAQEMVVKTAIKVNSEIENEELANVVSEVKKESKITIEPVIDLEKFKKSKIGIKFEKVF